VAGVLWVVVRATLGRKKEWCGLCRGTLKVPEASQNRERCSGDWGIIYGNEGCSNWVDDSCLMGFSCCDSGWCLKKVLVLMWRRTVALFILFNRIFKATFINEVHFWIELVSGVTYWFLGGN